KHAEEGRIVFGELQGGVSHRVRTLAETFNRAGLPAEASADIRAILWGKLCWNAAFNAINTLVGGEVRRLVEEPQSRQLCRRVMEEVRAVAASQGVPLPETVIDKLIRWTEGVDVLMVTSTRQDFEAGKPLEADALNGVVVRKGREAGVPTPYNFTLYTLLKALSPTP
ncbi:MAG: ketopantoate reductase family protein, partial [Candidatus Binatia bacterium]